MWRRPPGTTAPSALAGTACQRWVGCWGFAGFAVGGRLAGCGLGGDGLVQAASSRASAVASGRAGWGWVERGGTKAAYRTGAGVGIRRRDSGPGFAAGGVFGR